MKSTTERRRARRLVQSGFLPDLCHDYDRIESARAPTALDTRSVHGIYVCKRNNRAHVKRFELPRRIYLILADIYTAISKIAPPDVALKLEPLVTMWLYTFW